jgi:hypothetical protein
LRNCFVDWPGPIFGLSEWLRRAELTKMSVTNNVEKMIQPAIIEITETDMAFSRVQLIRSAQISSSDHLKLENEVNLVVKHSLIMKPNHEIYTIAFGLDNIMEHKSKDFH